MTPPQYAISPESTGTYTCLACGNREHFIGIDENGWGGPDECEGSCKPDLCSCLTTLTQPFTVDPDASDADRLLKDERGILVHVDIDYASFTGGGCDAEIGSYTRIDCAVCHAVLFDEAGSVGDTLDA